MANTKREVYQPKPMTEGKAQIIQGLMNEYDIKSLDNLSLQQVRP